MAATGTPAQPAAAGVWWMVSFHIKRAQVGQEQCCTRQGTRPTVSFRLCVCLSGKRSLESSQKQACLLRHCCQPHPNKDQEPTHQTNRAHTPVHKGSRTNGYTRPWPIDQHLHNIDPPTNGSTVLFKGQRGKHCVTCCYTLQCAATNRPRSARVSGFRLIDCRTESVFFARHHSPRGIHQGMLASAGRMHQIKQL